MDSQTGRLAWNPYWNNLLANGLQSYYMREWSTGSVGTAGYVLSSNGTSNWTWKDPATIPSLKGQKGDTGGAAQQVDIYNGNNTWSKPSGATIIQVEAWGGGGGGATWGNDGGHQNAGGGGGGEYRFKTFRASDLPSLSLIHI